MRAADSDIRILEEEQDWQRGDAVGAMARHIDRIRMGICVDNIRD